MNPPAPTEAASTELSEILFAADDSSVFAALDGASAPKLVQNLYQHRPEHCCLYPGQLNADMATVAPYLVRLEPGTEFTQLVLKEGWGAHWGIFLASNSDLRTLRDHLREFHKVELPDQRTVIFRYYDPRVLRIFLPVCNQAELTMFFGPVQSFIVEGEPPQNCLQFHFAGQALKSEVVQLKKPE